MDSTTSQCGTTSFIETSFDDPTMIEQNKRIDEKIKNLLDDILIQQHHIAQSCNALNKCVTTFEFSGSSESSIVAEWKLLLSS